MRGERLAHRELRLLGLVPVRYIMFMKRAEVQLPEVLYEQVEGLAHQLHLSVPELLVRAAEQLVQRPPPPPPSPNGQWRFPEGQHMGAFRAPTEDWRLLANEPAAD